MAAPVPPPIRAQPSAKEKKYDRQLRLWAANGQSALESAHVLLINSGTGVVGVETLKNLILPGIGQFTIQDAAQVTEPDLGVNFFLEPEDIGKFRAQQTTERLLELNPDVKGHAITEPLETFISQPNILAAYSFILAALPLPSDVLSLLVEHATQSQIPIFYVQSIGFYAHLTAQLPTALPIVDSHPDPATTSDLRLLEPWPELSQLARDKTIHLDQMSDEDHGHVPYVLLLLHYLDEWRANSSGAVPSSPKEKIAFRKMIQSKMRTNSAAGDEENYEEAVNAVMKTIVPHKPSMDVKEILTAPETKNLTSTSRSFWLIAHAVNEFWVKNGVLPLSGSFPDMKAKSHDYVTLQNFYRAKARADVDTVTSHVRRLEQHLERKLQIADAEITLFCKSASTLKLMRGRPPQLANPTAWGSHASSMVSQLSMPDSLLPLYIAFLAYNSYSTTHGLQDSVGLQRGQTDDEFEVEQEKMIGIAGTFVDGLLKDAGERLEDPTYTEVKAAASNCVRELVRANGAELHNVSAVMGGIAAQEVIKVITEQYVPIDNVCLFDGIASKTSVLRM
ncbi:MAG: hypothetical protein Q9162_005083 [Coniocarpon cinnabarinum]